MPGKVTDSTKGVHRMRNQTANAKVRAIMSRNTMRLHPAKRKPRPAFQNKQDKHCASFSITMQSKSPGILCRGPNDCACYFAAGFALAFAPHTPVSMSTAASSVTGVKVSCITMTPASIDTTVDTLPNIDERATGSLASE